MTNVISEGNLILTVLFDPSMAYQRDYEATHYRYQKSNRRVGEATRGLFASWFPRPLRSLVRRTDGLSAFWNRRLGSRPSPRGRCV